MTLDGLNSFLGNNAHYKPSKFNCAQKIGINYLTLVNLLKLSMRERAESVKEIQNSKR